jgi:hypothetical protein
MVTVAESGGGGLLSRDNYPVPSFEGDHFVVGGGGEGSEGRREGWWWWWKGEGRADGRYRLGMGQSWLKLKSWIRHCMVMACSHATRGNSPSLALKPGIGDR